MDISQDSKEFPQNFLFRAIELEDRLPFASGEAEAEEQFGADLIQRKLMSSVGTDLRSAHIKSLLFG